MVRIEDGLQNGSAGLLSRRSPVPLYYQVEEVLEGRILSGRWKAGDRIPSERELCLEFGVSRAVVRPALTTLEEQGRLVRIQGSGTFVAPEKQLVPVRGLVATFARRIGPDTEVNVIDVAHRPPDERFASVVTATDSNAIVHVSALIKLASGPSFLCTSTIALEWAPWLESVLQPGARLSGCGPFGHAALGTTRLHIENGLCPGFESEQLGIPPRSPVFVIQQVQHGVATGGQPPPVLEAGWVISGAATACLEVELPPR